MGEWKRTTLIGVGAVTVLVISAACTNSDTGRENSAGQTTSATGTAPATTTPAADTDAHNNADVWFVRHMIPYHQEAIELSDIVSAKQGIDSRVTELANKIRATQGPQLQQMQDWLNHWGNPPMPGTAPGDVQMPAQSNMPGILSKRELDALREANGADASTLFLTQMIAHHEGAIDLAQTEIEEGQYPAAVALARSIVSTQQQEIDTMKRILSSM